MLPNNLTYDVCNAYISQSPTGSYVYFPDIFGKRVATLLESLPPCFDVYYSLKSNPDSSLINQIKNRPRVGFDVSSAGELKSVLECGSDTSAILFVGPGKTTDELSLFVESTDGILVIESLTELQIISRIIRSDKKAIKVLLRINPSYPVKGVKMAMGGKETQFGVMEEDIKSALEIIDAHPHIRFLGFHTYVGTRILSAEDCVHNIFEAINFSYTFHDNVRPIQLIDVGGGIGIPYFLSEPEFDLEMFRLKLNEAMNIFPKSFLNHIKIILESGRFLSGPSGVFIARVDDVHIINGNQTIYLNTSPAQFGLSSHSMRSDLVYRMSLLSNSKMDQSSISTTIIGNLTCHDGKFASNVSFPHAKKGDIICFQNAGAYGLTAHNLRPYLLPTPQVNIFRESNFSSYALAS